MKKSLPPATLIRIFENVITNAAVKSRISSRREPS